MFTNLSRDPQVFIHWDWKSIKPYADDLAQRPVTSQSVLSWVMDWSDLNRLVSEIFARLWVATTLNTADQEAKTRFNTFLDEIFTPSLVANQVLKQKLLASGLQPPGLEIPLRNMRVEAEIYREENLPLLNEEKKLANEYDELISAQTVEWEGKEVTITQLQPVYHETDRVKREKAWRLEMERKLADRQKLNALWSRLMEARRRIAAQAGFTDYLSYRWKELLRFEYTPEDCLGFHQTIRQVAVPAARRIYEKRRSRLGLASLRPWDLQVDPLGREPLRPFKDIGELVEKASAIFHKVDPQLGDYFDIMRNEGLLDLENRKDKSPGAYYADYDMIMRPFIFENAVGLHTDVSTLVHEGGHAFHIFEEAHLPYYHQIPVGMEFAEVASTAMELLAAPYLSSKEGGFYTEREAARALIEYLEEAVLFWPYMAVVDAFQHWAYTNQEAATDPEKCDEQWAWQWQQYMTGVDWSDLDDVMVTGWQRKQHIFESAFYYIEYGIASLGAFQVWANALKDRKGAVAAYRRALALGGTATLTQLYETAGARFAFDASMFSEVIDMIDRKIEALERV
jgi:oligoendopeptidase F